MLFKNTFIIFAFLMGVFGSLFAMERKTEFEEFYERLRELKLNDSGSESEQENSEDELVYSEEDEMSDLINSLLVKPHSSDAPVAIAKQSRPKTQALKLFREYLEDDHMHLLQDFVSEPDEAAMSLWYNKMLWPINGSMSEDRIIERSQRRQDVEKYLKLYNQIRLTKEGPHVKDPLHEAVKKGLVETIIRLVNWGADVNFPNFQGATPMHMLARIAYGKYAEQEKAHAIARYLLAYKGDPYRPSNIGDTPLCWAVEDNRLELVRIYFDDMPQQKLQSFIFNQPLEWAARSANPEMIRLLIHYGAREYQKALEIVTAAKNELLQGEQTDFRREKIQRLEGCILLLDPHHISSS